MMIDMDWDMDCSLVTWISSGPRSWFKGYSAGDEHTAWTYHDELELHSDTRGYVHCEQVAGTSQE
jgi:hypothetical protein